MNLLKSFAALTLVTSLLLALLPEGSLRRTAAMVAGLLLLLTWSEGLRGLLHLPEDSSAPAAVLTPTGTTVGDLAVAAQATVSSAWEVLP